MCGIFGIYGEDIEIDKRAVNRFFILSSSRGKEASGLFVSGIGNSFLLKAPLPPAKFIRSLEYNNIILLACENNCNALIGHSRLMTDGSAENNKNNQPIFSDNFVGVHNGIIANAVEIKKKYGIRSESESDSEVLFRLLERFIKEGGSCRSAVRMLSDVVEGTFSIAFFYKNPDIFILATNNGSLYFTEDKGKLVFSSEERILKKCGYSVSFQVERNNPVIRHIDSGFGEIKDLSFYPLVSVNSYLPKYDTAKYSYDTRDNKLRRCSRCVLPETMPFISFDSNGVCSYCKSYKPVPVKGESLIFEIAEKIRGRGRYDCLVALSGGRDSSYGLHYIRNVLKLNPVAYTYDWGMVNSLARRNQARICGKLGVEHIVVSADISKKRKHIRENVEAWLSNPSLCAIPIFMAGDKMFFYYANKLAEEMGIKNIFFCENNLERTDFKAGFCGIDMSRASRGEHHTLYSVPLFAKLKLAVVYGCEFMKNPGYINGSLIDSFLAYLATYFIRHNYTLLFKYINWDEKEIVDTLIEEYNWEVARDTKSTWRIGDATAPFYNYIYYKMAGFSEYDTFRSNQIREGLISREKALEMLAVENMPRWPSIIEYLELLGLNFYDVMERINNVSKF